MKYFKGPSCLTFVVSAHLFDNPSGESAGSLIMDSSWLHVFSFETYSK